MSTHEVRVIRVGEVVKHPNADRLGLVQIDGFTAIVRLDDFKSGDLGAYIEPDYLVPDTPDYAFLKGKLRIRSQKLRGVWSQGLLVHAPDGAEEGACVMERLGIKRYEPPAPAEQRAMHGQGGKLGNSQAEKPHPTLAGIGVYDLENWRKHGRVLEAGEIVHVTEKLHGCNARFAWRGGRMYAGSRTQWRKSGEHSRWQKLVTRIRRWWRKSKRPNTDLNNGNVWWRVLKTHPWIVDWCRAHPDCVLYGEIFGDVQDLKYHARPGEVWFLAFDVLRDGKWIDAQEFFETLPASYRVPLLYVGPYSPAQTEDLSRLNRSTMADHLAEGVVIKPAKERWDGRVGRVALKLVSDLYLERAS